MSRHGQHCPTPLRGDCLKFSTDGTRLGADIAHVMGTSSEDEIMSLAHEEYERKKRDALTGMSEEQADWEDGLEEAPSSYEE